MKNSCTPEIGKRDYRVGADRLLGKKKEMVVTSEESRASGWTGLSRRDRTADEDDDLVDQKRFRPIDEEPRSTEKKVMTFTGERLILRPDATEKKEVTEVRRLAAKMKRKKKLDLQLKRKMGRRGSYRVGRMKWDGIFFSEIGQTPLH